MRIGILHGLALGLITAGIISGTSIAQQLERAAYPTASSPLFAEIQDKLDTKNASVGEPFHAKLVGDFVLGDGRTIPSGSIVLGQVTAVHSMSSGNGEASMMLVFNQLEPRKQATPIPIRGVLIGIAPKPYLQSSGPSFNNLPLASDRSIGNLAGETGSVIDTMMPALRSVNNHSEIRGVTLAPPANDGRGLLTSRKDIKIGRGTLIAVGLVHF